jgi:hypothetical protein
MSLVTEGVAALIFGGLGLLYLLHDPQSRDFFLKVSNSPVTPDPAEVIALFKPYLMRPGTLYLLLVFGALLVPLLEEGFKPVGVWLLAGRSISAAEGFTAGLLSGAGYALFENFTLSAGGGGNGWAMTATARTGTSLVHMLTTGLMGWALALAWRERRYLRLAVTYLLAIFIHGVWNTMVILAAMAGLPVEEFPSPDFVVTLGRMAPLVLASLLLVGLLLFLKVHARFKQSLSPAIYPPHERET